MFVVEGGEFTGTDFTSLVDGSKERYGPFFDKQEAFKVWNAKTWARVDVCCHRLFLKEE